jgi:hypothetical protein
VNYEPKQNFRTLVQHLLGEKYVTQKETKKEKRRKIIPKIVDTAMPEGRACSMLGPICSPIIVGNSFNLSWFLGHPLFQV